jgi:hypothetical protein
MLPSGEKPFLILNLSHILKREEIRKSWYIFMLCLRELLQGNVAKLMGTIIADFRYKPGWWVENFARNLNRDNDFYTNDFS